MVRIIDLFYKKVHFGKFSIFSFISALLATFLGVFLALWINTLQETVREERVLTNQFASTVAEINNILWELVGLKSAFNNESASKLLELTPSEILTINLPPSPITAYSTLNQLISNRKNNMDRIVQAHLNLTLARRTHKVLTLNTSDDLEIISNEVVRCIDFYVKVLWSLRNIYLESDDEFDYEYWHLLVEQAKSDNSFLPFFTG